MDNLEFRQIIEIGSDNLDNICINSFSILLALYTLPFSSQLLLLHLT